MNPYRSVFYLDFSYVQCVRREPKQFALMTFFVYSVISCKDKVLLKTATPRGILSISTGPRPCTGPVSTEQAGSPCIYVLLRVKLFSEKCVLKT